MLVVVELELESDKREVNMKYQADFRFESNSISKEQSKPSIFSFSPLSFTHKFILNIFMLFTWSTFEVLKYFFDPKSSFWKPIVFSHFMFGFYKGFSMR